MKNLITILVSFVILTLMCGCEEVFIETPARHPEANFEKIWSTFHQESAPFEERGVDLLSVYDTYRPQVDANPSDDKLFSVIAQMLKTLDDGHVSLTAPNQEVFYSNRIRRERTDDQLFSTALVKNYLERGFEEGEEQSYIYGKIRNEAIGYIFFDYVG